MPARIRTADQRLVVAIGLGQLEDRIVGIAAKRQRRERIDQLAERNVIRGRQDRPFAEPLADGAPVLPRFQLVGPKLDRLPHVRLGLFQQAGIFHHPADMLQHHHAVGHLVGRGLGREINEAAPLVDGQHAEPGILIGTAEINLGVPELGIKLDRHPQRMDRTREIARLPNGDRVVEINEMQQRMRFVIGEPGLVDLDRFGPGASRRTRLGITEEVRYREALQTRHLDHVGKCRRCVVSLHLAFGHASPKSIQSARDPCRVLNAMNSRRSLP